MKIFILEEQRLWESLDYPIKPSQINVGKFFTAFSDDEKALAANGITRLCQAKHDWVDFTADDLAAHFSWLFPFHLDGLLDEKYLVKKGTAYVVTDKFVRACCQDVLETA
ncbi:MAG: hypothetical protein AAB487_02005 [Patescibacteria group bacterium]